MKILITGGAGFMGSEFVRQKAREHKLVVVDKLTYAGDMRRLNGVKDKITFMHGDIADAGFIAEMFDEEKPDAVINFAAETHVDRSIVEAQPFIMTNVLGTQILLDMSFKKGAGRFIHISTDEVYGQLGKYGKFVEDMPLKPNSPYSASKASSELLVRAYYHTHKLPCVVARPSNNYGPYQYPEKFIALLSTNLLEAKPVPVYGKGEQMRDWLHVSDCCKGIDMLLQKGEPGEVYNLGGESEYKNIDVSRKLIQLAGVDESHIRFVPDRPGHDFRYALDNSKVRKLGWQPSMDFEKGLRETFKWYKENTWWWEPIKRKLGRETKGFWT